MRIESSDLAMQASYQSLSRTESQQSLMRRDNSQGRRNGAATALNATSHVSISQAARMTLQIDTPTVASASTSGATDNGLDGDPVVALIKSMVEMITGRAIKVFSAADLPPMRSAPSLAAPNTDGSQPRPSPPAGMAYDSHYLHEEHEQLSFKAEGTIKTSDGQQIHFSLDLQMERHYREESTLSIRTGDTAKKDPLVLNFAGTAAQLTNRFIRFDLNGDGKAELLPGLAEGSAYLVLDRNHNGRIDDGSELFGPATDQGFAELAKLDSDHNGWLDEADPAFAGLGLWNPGSDTTTPVIQSLTEAGVGALALANIATPFQLRGTNNDDLGALRATGLFVGEKGNVGTIQEVDLTQR